MTIAIYERVMQPGPEARQPASRPEDLGQGQQATGQAIKWYADKFTGKSWTGPA